MDVRDAVRLIAPAVGIGERWADLGAGRGTFTAALARLIGPSGTVYAIERDAASIASLEAVAGRISPTDHAPVVVRHADFTREINLPATDGALLANALHFVATSEQSGALSRIARLLVTDGKILVVEYDDRPSSRWVPFPVSLARLEEIAAEAGFAAPRVVGRRHSEYGGTMYAALIPTR